MANVFIQDSTMRSIGEAIREKTGGVALIYPKDMAAQISSIKTGAVLQEKTIAPTTYQQEVTPDAEYDGLSKVTVEAMQVSNTASPVIEVSDAGLIQASVQYSEGYITEDTKKTAVKQLPTKAGERVIPSTADKVAIEAGVFTTWPVTVAGDANLVPEKIKKDESIFGILGTYEGEVGGGSDIVRYVTFLNEDGTTLYQMPVLVGDDCKDPVTHGDISKPTKESTNTQVFTYSGWTSTVGGTADADILKNITEDKTVYVAYAVSVRYYTVTFYDDDNTTVLNTMQVEYGADVSDYVPEKENYTFVEWNPSVSNITSDFDTVAVWEDYVKNEWDYLAESIANGTYKSDYSIGYSVPLTCTIDDTETTINMVLVAFDHDDKEDGSGKAAMTFISERTLPLGALATSTSGSWGASEMRTNCVNLLSSFPSNVANQIKTVKKVYATYASTVYSTGGDSVWVPSVTEIGFTTEDNDGVANQGSHYSEYFTSASTRVKRKFDQSETVSAQPWQTRSRYRGSNLHSYQLTVTAGGSISKTMYSAAKTYYAPIGFCI